MFEGLAVASRPLQRRRRRNNLHRAAHEDHFESGKQESRKRISETKDKGHRGDRARAGAKRISNLSAVSFPDSEIFFLSGFDIRPSAFSTHP